MKGKAITASVNKKYALMEFFDSDNRLKCPECECLLDPYYRSLRIEFNSHYDFSCTYDGVFITSKRFKEYIQSMSYKNLIFYPVNENNIFFYFQVMNSVVVVDKNKTGIKYDKKCKTCNYPSQIFGGPKIFIDQAEPLADGFHTTDTYWRTGSGYRPKILIGLETYEKLKTQKFKGLDMARNIF